MGALGLVLSVTPSRAHGMNRDARTVLLATTYGTGAGTLLGLAFWPLSGDWRAIFVGMGVGFVLGAGVGTYHIFHRKDPNNPLAFDTEEERDVDHRRLSGVLAAQEGSHWDRAQKMREGEPGLRFSLPVAQF